jgi:hypothetical protein
MIYSAKTKAALAAAFQLSLILFYNEIPNVYRNDLRAHRVKKADAIPAIKAHSTAACPPICGAAIIKPAQTTPRMPPTKRSTTPDRICRGVLSGLSFSTTLSIIE